MKRTFFFLAVILFLMSCHNSNKEYVLDKNISKVGFKIQFVNEPIIGKEMCTYLYFEKSKYRIIDAYYDCDSTYTPQSIDIKNGKINSCKNHLYLEGDTVKICLVRLETGVFKFHKIKLLFTDKEKKYYVADTTFQFYVRDSI
jgi:hypothetical protein